MGVEIRVHDGDLWVVHPSPLCVKGGVKRIMPECIGLIHDLTWNLVGFLFNDGQIKFRGSGGRDFPSVTLEKPFNGDSRLLGGLIYKDVDRTGDPPLTFPNCVVAIFSSGDSATGYNQLYYGLHYGRSRKPVLFEAKVGPDTVFGGTYQRPHIDVWGNAWGTRSLTSWGPKKGVWTTLSHRGTVKFAEHTGEILAVHEVELRTGKIVDTRTYSWPWGDFHAWEIRDIHPTLGTLLVFQCGDWWRLVRIPTRGMKLSPMINWCWAKTIPLPPHTWTRLGVRHGFTDSLPLLRRNLIFEFWNGETVCSSDL